MVRLPAMPPSPRRIKNPYLLVVTNETTRLSTPSETNPVIKTYWAWKISESLPANRRKAAKQSEYLLCQACEGGGGCTYEVMIHTIWEISRCVSFAIWATATATPWVDVSMWDSSAYFQESNLPDTLHTSTNVDCCQYRILENILDGSSRSYGRYMVDVLWNNDNVIRCRKNLGIQQLHSFQKQIDSLPQTQTTGHSSLSH